MEDDLTKQQPTLANGSVIDLDDLYDKLHGISKCFEGSDVCYSDNENGFYPAILEAMGLVAWIQNRNSVSKT